MIPSTKDFFILDLLSYQDKNGNTIYAYGSSELRPQFDTTEHRGYLYYDTDNSKLLIWSGGNWRDTNGGYASSIAGTVDNRPDVNTMALGLLYFNNTLRKLNIAMRGSYWIDALGHNADAPYYGTTELRVSTNIRPGFQYFDTTLNKPIWWTGSKWVDATGADV